MFFENTERKIISHVFNADPKMIPTITHIYNMDAEINRDEFKSVSTVLVFYSVIAVLMYQFLNFAAWPVLSAIFACFVAMNIFSSAVMLTVMLLYFVIGNCKLRIFRKVIAAYEINLTKNGGDNYEGR